MPSPEDLPDPGIKLGSPALQADSLPTEPPGTPQMALVVKSPPASAGDIRDVGRPLGREDPLEKDVATHSSILARKIPGTEEPGGLQSMGSQRVRHD